MEEPIGAQKPKEDTAPKPDQVVTGKSKGKAPWLPIILVVILVASLGFQAWYWVQAEAEKKSLNDQIAQLNVQLNELKAEAQKDQAEQIAETPEACNDTATEAKKENIKAALDSKNTAAFQTYTSDPVNYILAASEYGGDVTPTEAATSLEYTHSATGPWDFNLPAATINAWKAGFYKDHFDDVTRYIGKAASGMVVSFDFDCNGKIDKIFVAADDDLL